MSPRTTRAGDTHDGTARRIARWSTLAAATLAAACLSIAEGRGPGYAGCYQFYRDEGARVLGLPWGLELLDEPLAGGWMVTMRFPDVMKALTATSPTAREDHPIGYWREIPGDSIELGHPGGGGGYTLLLTLDGQDLVGRATAVGDAGAPGQPRPTRAVTAYRVLCGAS
jgi:hypothetical protein